MTIYPVEFYRRSEQKWARRAGVSRTGESTTRAAHSTRNERVMCLDRAAPVTEGEMPPNQERDDILARVPWLLAIGQELQVAYSTFEQPVSERLTALLKEFEGPPPRAH